MAFVRKKKIVYKKYKGKTKHYVVYELHLIYRHPANKKKMINRYLCYLGKKKYGPDARKRIERFLRDRKSIEVLMKKLARELNDTDPAKLKEQLNSI